MCTIRTGVCEVCTIGCVLSVHHQVCVKCAPPAALLVDSKRQTLMPPSKLYTMRERVIHKGPTWLPGNVNLSALPDRRGVKGTY